VPTPPGDTRHAILRAADEIGAERGWKSATMREIAKRAGCSPMAAYRHFPSRDALLGELAERHFARLAERMGRATARARPGRATVAAVHAYVGFALEEPSAYALLYGSSPEQPRHGEPRAGGWAVGAAVAAAMTRDTGRECAGSSDEVLMLWAGVHGLVTLSASPQLPLTRRALLRLTDRMVGLAIG
jgi:AcrR family transcriptional regulator